MTATRFLGVGERDRVIAELQARFPGHRPVLFHSPYEAAAWSIISARRPSAVAAKTRAAISEQLGRAVDRAMGEGSLYDRELAALAVKLWNDTS